MSRGVLTMTLFKTTWSGCYDPLLNEFLGPGSTSGVVSKYYTLTALTKKHHMIRMSL